MMKQGEPVFLQTSPEIRGNVSLVGDDWFDVTWHAFRDDRPDAEDLRVLDGKERTRVRYSKSETRNIGFGVPSA
jgi:hypothetical protein